MALRLEVAAELGRDHQPVAARLVAPDVVAEDLFGVALGVEVGGVDEVAAQVDVAVNDLLRLLDRGAPSQVLAKGHGAQGEGADAQTGTAERDVMVKRHGLAPLC